MFIEKSIMRHGDKYNYGLVNYINNKTSVKIICSEHGVFEQLPKSHLSGFGCAKCSLENEKIKLRHTFIKKAIILHGNKFDYSLVKYVNKRTKVKIICPKHGIFEQTPFGHLNSSGCKKCNSAIKQYNQKRDFIEKSKEIHNNKYDYSLVEYINNYTKVKIICSEHGVFEQRPDIHVSGHGCFKCNKYSKKEFIEKSNKIHYNKFDYSMIEYINTTTKIKIICPKHGIFEQIPKSHLNGIGCSSCNCSKGETNIMEILKKYNIKFNTQKTFKECKLKSLLRFDFYLPEHNICIEYDGIQHFEAVEYFGGEEGLKNTQLRDTIKNEYCINNNIEILRIKYNENIEEIIYTLIYNFK